MTGPVVPIGAPVLGNHGETLGVVGAVYVDNETGRLAWAAVQGRRHSAVVPLQVSRFDGATLYIPYGADRLASAPLHDPDTMISYAEGDELARHYGLIPAPSGTGDTGGDPTDPPDSVTMTRSEEQLRTETINVVVGRARLVTYVVTEEQTFTVPVRRQVVRLVYDAVPDEEQVVADVGPAEHVHEVVLHSEQVLFSSRVIPVERVRLVRRVVTGECTVADTVQSEQIDGHIDTQPGIDTHPGGHHRSPAWPPPAADRTHPGVEA